MSKLTLSYQNLYDEISFFLGLTPRGTTPTSTNLTTCKDIVHRGIRNFLYPLDENGLPHEWEFLKLYWSFNVVSGQWRYALPTDFSELCGTFHYDSTSANPPLFKRSAEQIIEMRSSNISGGYPEYYAITPAKYDADIGTVYEIWLYPTPGQVYTLSTFYRADPIQLSETTDLAIGGIRATEAILESCLAVAEQQEDDTIGLHTSAANSLIQKLIKFDKITKTEKIGNLYRRGRVIWPTPRGYFTFPDMDNVYEGD